VLGVEFYARGDQLLESWSAESEVTQSFAEGDVVTIEPPPAGFISETEWVIPDYFYTVEFFVGSEVGGRTTSDISGTFESAEISGSDWRDQEGRLLPPQC
jgi:hypothetical protein